MAEKGKSGKGKAKGKGKGKKEKTLLGPSTVVKPCILGATVLLVIQTAMHVFLKA